MSTRRQSFAALLLAAVLIPLEPQPGGAITGGEPDQGRHPYVGGTVLYFPPRDETIVNCTGTLLSPIVFVTAAHCGRHGSRRSVAFDEVFDAEKSTRFPGTFRAHPEYDPMRPNHNDVAVIVLDEPVAGVDPAQLPTLPPAGLLDEMKDEGTLDQSSRFTSVGYGFLGFTMGPGGPTPVRGQVRHYAAGSFNALSPEQLHLSQNPALGDEGTCNGDSGGPNFLGAGDDETRIVVSITSTGDTYCKATNVTYRLDAESARAFLGEYVPLP